MVITRLGPLSCAKIAAIVYALLGLAFGTVISLFSLVGGFATAAFAADPTRRAGLGGLLGISAILVLPLVYGLFGFVVTLVSAWLYNAVAKLIGGIEIDLQ